MTDDDDPPNNVVPFRHVIPYAVAQGLRDYYASLLCEPMPEKIAALSQEFEKLAKDTENKDTEDNDSEEKPREPRVG
jgi:hypothetical protein